MEDNPFHDDPVEGEDCPRKGCHGNTEFDLTGCTCHMGNPPCSVCTDSTLTCTDCAWPDEE